MQHQSLKDGAPLTVLQAQRTFVEYYHNDEKLIFPLAAPITTRVKHAYRVGGWTSCKWGPPPNVDGTPSSESSKSTTVVPAITSTSTTRVVESSSPSAAASFNHSLSPRPAAPIPATASSHWDSTAYIKTVRASQDPHSNAVHPINKTATIQPPTSVTLQGSPVHLEKTTSKSHYKSGGVGGNFELVTKAELDDDEFDVQDNEGPSASNGAVRYPSAIMDDVDSTFHKGWEEDE